MTDPKLQTYTAISDAGAAIALARTALVSMVMPDPFALVDKTAAVDVTDAIQKAIDAGIPIPAGRYLVDPVVGLHASRDIWMDDNAVFVARANSATKYRILTLGDGINARIGRIMGDRMGHTYVAGSTSEWGCGVFVAGKGVKLSIVGVSNCTGDGIEVVGANCTIRDTISTGNRRQGMSVFNAPGLKVYNSKFLATGALGADPAAPNGPCAGVDIEPDAAPTGQPAPVVDAYFEGCTFDGNRAGFLAWLRSEVGGAINVELKDCELGNNANGIDGKALAGKVNIKVTKSRFNKNTGSAVKAEPGATITVGTTDPADANTIVGMSTRTAALTGPLTGIRTKYDLQATAPGVINAGVNDYA